MALKKATFKQFYFVEELLNSLSDKQYSQSLEVASGSSVGQHVRHIVEFYECLFLGEKEGIVSYDTRERKLIYETDKEAVLSLLNSFKQTIEVIDFKKQVTLISSFSTEDEAPNEVISSVEREIIHNLEHAIHHLAVIKVIIKHHFPEIILNENLGMAPSTIRFEKEICVQ